MEKYSLKSSKENGRLRFVLGGRIDSTNSRVFAGEVAAELEKHPNSGVIFDCGGLEHLSSAGLRVFLALSGREGSQEGKRIRLVNVPQNIYDIFDMTGFSRIFEVSKALRDVSNEETRKMGYSSGITVYYIGEDTLMKVYPAGTSLESIEQERKYAQAALLSGIPTLIAYDVVTYQGHYGMLYELVKANTVAALLESSPWKLEQYAEKMGRLLKRIHSSVPKDVTLPRAPEIYKNWAYMMAPWLHSQEINALTRLIEVVPEEETVVYGNFNARSVFIQHGEPILINMAGISSGNPVYDLGTAYMFYRNESEDLIKRFSGLEPFQAERFWNAMIRAYFNDDGDAVGRYEETIRAAALLRSVLYPAAYRASHGSDMTAEDAELFVAQARRDLFPSANHLTLLLGFAKFV
ncbi:MAG: STAS domain-containing protein [Fretibacterium sp.]|nr:STAS domain-containing protein [Fretibacterium sp.]